MAGLHWFIYRAQETISSELVQVFSYYNRAKNKTFERLSQDDWSENEVLFSRKDSRTLKSLILGRLIKYLLKIKIG